MKLKKWIKIILIGSSVLALAACSSKHKRAVDDAAINDANAAYSSGAQSSGLGEESQFGDQAGGGMSASNKHIYYFDFDSDVVHADDKPAIDANANRIAGSSSRKVMLEGHTDPRGSREYNIGLGERRAKSVAQLLTEKGVSPAQVRVVSYGAEKLAAQGHSDSDYQLDRRVVLVYMQK